MKKEKTSKQRDSRRENYFLQDGNVCSKGGVHTVEYRQGGLGQHYQACIKCGLGIRNQEVH